VGHLLRLIKPGHHLLQGVLRLFVTAEVFVGHQQPLFQGLAGNGQQPFFTILAGDPVFDGAYGSVLGYPQV